MRLDETLSAVITASVVSEDVPLGGAIRMALR